MFADRRCARPVCTARSLALPRGRSDGTSVRRCDRRPVLHKKTQSGSPNGVRIEGHVMAHRADIVGGSTGQTRPGNGTCRRAPNGAPPRKQSFARTSACCLLRRQELLPPRRDGSYCGPCDLSRTLDPKTLDLM